jgi:prepilin-type N-terminal cleavage/methylation domain-containing protein
MVARRWSSRVSKLQSPRARSLSALAHQRAYTLVELMAVVSIVAILATLAVFGTRKYIAASKTAEATSMIANIRAAEESYRDETFKYLGIADFTNWHPVDVPSNKAYSWIADNGAISTVFNTLGVQPSGPVRYVYTVVAGDVGATIPELPTKLKRASFNFPTVTGPFYVVAAKADFQGTGRLTFALAHSYSSAVHIEE